LDLSYEELHKIWEHFVSGGENLKGLREEVAKSWLRCREMGYNPLQKTPKVDRSKYKWLMERNSMLVNTASPFIDLISKLVYGTGFVVVLVDKDGYILEMKGSKEAIEQAKQNNYDICSNRSESVAGTNAISLALTENKAIQLEGPEHYNVFHQNWTCAATPIHTHDGKLIGVFNLSGHSSLIHKHTLGMVVSLGQAIEREFLIQEKNRKLRFVNENLKAVIDSISEGVIAINKKGVITEANSKVVKMLNIDRDKLYGVNSLKIFGKDNPLLNAMYSESQYFDNENNFTIGTKKMSFVTTIRQIKNEKNEITGLVGILKEKKDIYRMVNKIIGTKAKFTFDNIIHTNPQMREAINMAQAVAGTDTKVLLEGESGTGKELFAQAIHNASDRHNGPFVAVNCSAIPRDLIESELFGYNEGAFTGAKRGGSIGKFELASGGTLFLDEVSSMPLEMQAKILRVLQQNEITRIGGTQSIQVDVRVISATNVSLEKLVHEGHFRLDLFYRLGVVIIKIPPLRERIEDIPVLFSHLLQNMCRKSGKVIGYNEDELMNLLCSYEWPGNVRELENYIERAVVLAKGSKLTKEHFPEKILQNSAINEFIILKPMSRHEKEIIEKTLVMFSGNISKASKNLGISRNTLYKRIREFNIKV